MILKMHIGDAVAEFHSVERSLYPSGEGVAAERDPYGFWNGRVSDGKENVIDAVAAEDLLKEARPIVIAGEGDCGKSVFLSDLLMKVGEKSPRTLIRLREYSGERISRLADRIREIAEKARGQNTPSYLFLDGADENEAFLSSGINLCKWVGDAPVRVFVTTRPREKSVPEFCRSLGAKVFHLLPMTQADAAHIANELGIDWDAFAKIAVGKMILSFCPRPEMLLQLLKMYKLGRIEGKQVKDLFAELSLELCREHRDGNPSGDILRSDDFSDTQILDAAGWIAAALQLQNRRMVRTSAGTGEDIATLPIADLVVEQYSEKLILTVLKGRMFEPMSFRDYRIGVNDIIPYLAARWMFEHLNVENAEMVLVDRTNPDAPRLYATLAWMASFRPGFANELLLERPEVALLNEETVCQYEMGTLYNALRKRYEALPHEKRQEVLRPLLCRLRDRGVEGILLKELRGKDVRRIHFAALIARECELVAMEPDLVNIVCNQTMPEDLRADISYDLAWLANVNKDRSLLRLRDLLKETPTNIQAETIRANALRCLCPDLIPLTDVLPCLIDPVRSNFLGAYAAFVEYSLPRDLDRMLNEDVAPQALKWAARHVFEDEPFDRLGELARNLFTRCWMWSGNDKIRTGLVDCIVAYLGHDKSGLPFVDTRGNRRGNASAIDSDAFYANSDARLRVLQDLACRQLKEKKDLHLDWIVGSYRDFPLVTEKDFPELAKLAFDRVLTAPVLAELLADLTNRIDLDQQGELLARLHSVYPHALHFDIGELRKQRMRGEALQKKWEEERREREQNAEASAANFRKWMHEAIAKGDPDLFPGFVNYSLAADGRAEIPPVDLRETKGWELLCHDERSQLVQIAWKYLETVCRLNKTDDHVCICCAARLVLVLRGDGELVKASGFRKELLGVLLRSEYYYGNDEVLIGLTRRLFGINVVSGRRILLRVLIGECQRGLLGALDKWGDLLSEEEVAELLCKLAVHPPSDLHFSRVIVRLANFSLCVNDWGESRFDWNASRPPDVGRANVIRALVVVDPKRKMRSLLRWIKSDEEWARSWFEAALESEDPTEFATCVLSCSVDQIAFILEFLDCAYPDEKSDRHNGAVSYSPDGIDKVYELKQCIENVLVLHPTEKGQKVLNRLRRKTSSVKWKQAFSNAAKRLASNKESKVVLTVPITMRELRLLLKPSNNKVRVLHTMGALRKYLMETLSEYDAWLRIGNNARSLWRRKMDQHSYFWVPKGELSLSDEIGDYIQKEARSLSAFREPFVGFYPKGGKRVRGFADLVVHAQDPNGKRSPAEVIIEVKGNWNREVRTNLKTQLVKCYLKGRPNSGGIFLCGCYNLPREKTVSKYRTSVEALASLNAQKEKLVDKVQRRIDVSAIDCSIRGVKAEKIRKC